MPQWLISRRKALTATTMAVALAGATAHLQAQTPQSAPAVASPATPVETPAPQLLPVEVIARHPHDPQAFTQGLLVHNGQFYESTGREGRSEIRRVEIATGRVLQRTNIPAAQFGEGMALWQDTLISLTWRNGIAHRWALRDFAPRTPPFRYQGEGWGLATAPDGLVMSDGSAELRFLDGASFAERRRVTVTLRGRPIRQLNELEVVDGHILANVWMTPFILVINPADGIVTHILDLRPVVAEMATTDPDAVLNGIAYDAAHRRLYITGKLWPKVFEIRLPQFTAG